MFITDSFGFFLTEQIEDQNNPGEYIDKPELKGITLGSY